MSGRFECGCGFDGDLDETARCPHHGAPVAWRCPDCAKLRAEVKRLRRERDEAKANGVALTEAIKGLNRDKQRCEMGECRSGLALKERDVEVQKRADTEGE